MKLETSQMAPGKSTKAFGIDKRHNRLDLRNDFLFKDSDEEFNIIETQRVGVRKGKEHLLRFYIKGSKFVSKK
jgi:DNA-3-methyladenine glycosylase